ncbi:MAG: UDP-N-acetylmuramoyl-tripeptide--D-alanyl-D-alanine ligase [Gammaproteobacteria bacterium]
MIAMSLQSTAATLGTTLDGADGPFEGVSTDTRTLIPGQLFFALRGPRHDAHDRLDDAAQKGAAGAVVERPTRALPALLVDDTRRSLGVLARAWRERHTLPLLAVTGSAGKTTVKEMLAAIMAVSRRTLATRGNFNNDIGVPLTLFGLGPEHEVAVIEMGANRPGDIAWLCEIARPDVGLITLCAPAHLEGFGNVETVARSKGEIITALAPDGVAVINNEDAFAPLWREFAGRRRVVSFGAGGMVSAHDVTLAAGHTRFRLRLDGTDIDVSVAHAGMHNVRNALAAAAAAFAIGTSAEDIAAGLAAAVPAKGRLQRRDAGDGLTLIDDSYNANPASLRAALEVLANAAAARWLVLGDMGELGDQSLDFHEQAGQAARANGVERLFTIGPLAQRAGQAFGPQSRHFPDLPALIEGLREARREQAGPVTLLIKGSRMMALDRVADALAAEVSPC